MTIQSTMLLEMVWYFLPLLKIAKNVYIMDFKAKSQGSDINKKNALRNKVFYICSCCPIYI